MRIWKRGQKILARLAFILLGVLLVLCLPVIIPAVAVDQWLYNRRLRAAARAFACPACGSVIGDAALHLADEAWAAHISSQAPDASMPAHKNSGPRILRHLRALCPHCGARYDFNERKKIFTPIGASTW